MYHGWTYHTNGDLDFVTQLEGYPDREFDPVRDGMGRVAQSAKYRGFVFANLSPRARSKDIWRILRICPRPGGRCRIPDRREKGNDSELR